jgi:hypothetical protein
MAKMNGKGKEKAIESNEDVEMPDADEDLRGTTWVRFLFLYIFLALFLSKLRTDHINFSSSPPRTANIELVLKMSHLEVLVIGGSKPQSTVRQ